MYTSTSQSGLARTLLEWYSFADPRNGKRNNSGFMVSRVPGLICGAAIGFWTYSWRIRKKAILIALYSSLGVIFCAIWEHMHADEMLFLENLGFTSRFAIRCNQLFSAAFDCVSGTLIGYAVKFAIVKQKDEAEED